MDSRSRCVRHVAGNVRVSMESGSNCARPAMVRRYARMIVKNISVRIVTARQYVYTNAGNSTAKPAMDLAFVGHQLNKYKCRTCTPESRLKHRTSMFNRKQDPYFRKMYLLGEYIWVE